MLKICKSPIRFTSICCALTLAGTLSSSGADFAATEKATALANKLAGNDMQYAALLCAPDQGAILQSLPNPKVPAKIFDNMYFLGLGWVNAFAITTSQGIIIIDTMNNAAEADKFIIDGVTKIGLNPQNIKYVIVTHGHGDHYGGAQELQNKIPGAHIMMSAADWDFSAKAAPKYGQDPPPRRDMVITDGQKLTLGDETLALYITPGHTPGTVSFVIPVKDHGKAHTVTLFGGSSFEPSRASLLQFHDSLVRFRGIEKVVHSEGRLSTHAEWSNSLEKLEELRDNPNGPNPFFETPEHMARFEKIQDACWQGILDKVP